MHQGGPSADVGKHELKFVKCADRNYCHTDGRASLPIYATRLLHVPNISSSYRAGAWLEWLTSNLWIIKYCAPSLPSSSRATGWCSCHRGGPQRNDHRTRDCHKAMRKARSCFIRERLTPSEADACSEFALFSAQWWLNTYGICIQRKMRLLDRPSSGYYYDAHSESGLGERKKGQKSELIEEKVLEKSLW